MEAILRKKKTTLNNINCEHGHYVLMVFERKTRDAYIKESTNSVKI